MTNLKRGASRKQACRFFLDLSERLVIHGVKKIDEVRRENLELLIKEYGTMEALAAAANTTSVYLSQVRRQAIDSKTGRPRQMGTDIARRLEAAEPHTKPAGWMDMPRTEDEIAEIERLIEARHQELFAGTDIAPDRPPSKSPAMVRQETLIAHELSVVPHRVPKTTISWESLMDMRTEIPDSFIAAVPDDALQPGAPRGTSFIFSRHEPPAPGKAVLVRDRDGNTYLRRFRQGVGALWSAQATNDAYATLESVRDGLMILAVATWRSGGDV